MQTGSKSKRGGARPGSGRKPRNSEQITLRISPEIIGMIRLAAERAGISMSELAEKALKDYFAKEFLETNFRVQLFGKAAQK